MANRFFPSYPTYRITSPFGMRTLRGTTRMHTGIDLVAKSASGGSCVDYITAHTGGTVKAVGYNSSAGNYVNIQVSNTTYMTYCHLKKMSTLKVGATVKKGDVIGYMGSTGNSTGAHLHWGIKRNGEWINPAPYLDKDYTEAEETKKVSIELNVLRNGSKGEQVKTLQRLLLSLGYEMRSNSGKLYGADGSFGGATENAVKAFQKAKGLAVDGVVGKATWSALLGA